tara:strand:+ start:307 stop:717 length:411 start_codon:yes stop_codon:yes gene_type:complete
MTWNEVTKHICSVILGLFFIKIGIDHLVEPEWFEQIVPKAIGLPKFWVLLTGIMEIALGLGLILPKLRSQASIAVVIFLIGIYSANLHMWVNNIPIDGNNFETKWHILRLLGQLLMIIIALWVGGWLDNRYLLKNK